MMPMHTMCRAQAVVLCSHIQPLQVFCQCSGQSAVAVVCDSLLYQHYPVVAAAAVKLARTSGHQIRAESAATPLLAAVLVSVWSP